MKWLKIIISILFFPVSIGLLWQTFAVDILSEKLLYSGFFLFSLEQTRMAIIDLKSYFIQKKQYKTSLISLFFFIVIITIIIELFGFYYALLSVGWGAIIVLISQVFFNIFSPIKVTENTLQVYELKDKITLLIADIVGILLIALWLMNIYPLIVGIFILLIMLIFMVIKYSISI